MGVVVLLARRLAVHRDATATHTGCCRHRHRVDRFPSVASRLIRIDTVGTRERLPITLSLVRMRFVPAFVLPFASRARKNGCARRIDDHGSRTSSRDVAGEDRPVASAFDSLFLWRDTL